MFRRSLIVFVLMSLLVPALSSIAQEPPADEHPLLEMLSYVPVEFAEGQWLRYQDYRAVEDALPYVGRPEGANPFFSDWLGYTFRWNSAPDGLQYLRQGAELYQETVGFQFRDVNRTFVAGFPPMEIFVWQGDFDEDAIAAAHAARDYAPRVLDEGTMWCFEDDCTNGMEVDLENRNPGNIFDPALGRRYPVVILEDTLLVSASDLALTEMASSAAASLLDDEIVTSLAEAAITPDGDLIGWQVYPVDGVIGGFDPAAELPQEDILLGASSENFANAVEAYRPIAPYQGFAFADRQEGDRQVTLILLSYDNEADAAFAAEEVLARVSTYSDIISRRGEMTPLIENIDGVQLSQRVYAASNGRFVAVIQIDGDTPTAEQAFAEPFSDEQRTPDGRMFRFIYQSILQRSFYPIWTGTE